MTPQTLIGLALQMPGAYEDHPFGPESVVIKVEGRIFAQIFTLRGVDSATLNCDRMIPGVVVRGYHCPPVQQPYFNTFPLGAVPDRAIREMLGHSYETVVGKLLKYKRERLKAAVQAPQREAGR